MDVSSIELHGWSIAKHTVFRICVLEIVMKMKPIIVKEFGVQSPYNILSTTSKQPKLNQSAGKR